MINKKSVIFRWTISYITVLLVALLICTTVYWGMEKTLKREINKSNDLFLGQVQQYIDGLLNDAKILGINIALNQNVQEAMSFETPLKEKDISKISDCVKDLQMYTLSNTSIDSVFIYFKNIGMVVNEKTYTNVINFYETFLSHKNISYDNWINTMYGHYNGQYISNSLNIGYNKNRIDTISYIRSAPITRPDKNLASIVININASKIFNMADNVENIHKSKLIILDRDNKVVWHTPSFSNLSNNISYDRMALEKGMFFTNNKEVISYTTSKNENWKYVLIMPHSIFYDRLTYARKLMYIGMIVLIVLGSMVTIILLRKNYRPINDLLKIISKEVNFQVEDKINEYSYIQNAVKKVLDEKNEINLRLTSQKQTLKPEIIEKLLKGKIGTFKSLKDFDINFKSEYFSVLLFYLEDFQCNTYENKTKSIDEIFKLFEDTVSNIVKEFTKNNQVYITYIEDMVFCLINYDDDNINENYDFAINISQRIRAYIISSYKLDFSIAVSNIHKNQEGVQDAYNETLSIIEYKERSNIKGIIPYEGIPKTKNTIYNYPIDKEQQLINCIKLSEVEKAKEIVQDIFSKNFNDINFSPYMAKCLIFSIIGTMFQTLNEVACEEDQSYLTQVNNIEELIEKLIKAKSINKIQEGLFKFIEDICEYVQLNKKSNNICNSIEEYILKSYNDMNLSVANIADNFNMNSCYISRIFKEQFGESILDCLNKVRIEKAKQLLIEQKLNVEEVASKVGYTNVRTFTRAFNKIQGVTPGKYRDTV